MRGYRIDIALSATALTGTITLRGTTHRADAPLPAPDPSGTADAFGNGWHDALHAALAALRGALERASGVPLDGAVARVVLLPPLAEARLIRLPPLRQAEAEAVAAREAGRHFVSMGAPRLVGVLRQADGPVLVAAVPAALVEQVHAAGERAGLRIETVAPAHAAWLEYGRRTAAHAVVAVTNGTAHVLRIANGHAAALRRVPLAAAEDIGGAAGDPPATAVVLAEDADRAFVRDALTAAGWNVAADATDAAAAAASRASAGVAFVSASAARQRRLHERVLAVRLAAAAALLVLAAAGLDYWSAGHAFAAARAERAAIRAEVEPLVALRDSLEGLAVASTVVDSVAAHAPRWTDALFDIAMLLPPETHLTRVYASSDTIVLEAAGARAGATLQALRSAASLHDARLLGVVDRELADGTTAVERFRIQARLAPAALRPRTAAARAGDDRTAGRLP